MMTIGEFAAMTGLTTKALRFYDEKGLLHPHEVDQFTGYRRYGVGQVRRAATIRLLRDMDMPVAQVREAVESPDRCGEVVARFGEAVRTQRRRQDEAMAVAGRLLRAYEEPGEVRVTHRPPQHWVGIASDVDLTSLDPADETAIDAANAAAGEHTSALFGALAQRQIETDGTFWTTFAPDPEGSGRGAMMMCLPVPKAVDDLHVDGAHVISGVLPERDELSVRWPIPAEDDVDTGGHVLPEVVTFFEALEERGLDERETRQVAVLGPDGVPIAMDLTVTL